MPTIPLSPWMDSIRWHHEPLDWPTYVYHLAAPQISVRGRMALLLVLAVVWALIWLSWRAYLVVQTPNDVLVDKLGLDIPPPVELTLEEIAAREVQVGWKQPELQNSIHKHIVEVNSIRVGETKRTETAVSILNLQPATFYDIRVFTVSAAGFQTPSALLPIRTPSYSKPDSPEDLNESYPTIRAYVQKSPAALPALSAPAMAREISGGQPLGRRGTTGRKNSPAFIGADAVATHPDDAARSDEEDGGLVQLSERFQKVQQDNDAAELQIVEEEKEFDAAFKDLETRRDELKQSLKERDEASNDLRKQVHKLESQNRTALSEKSKKARLLQQKENQHMKRRDEIAVWEDQISSMTEEIAGIETQKAAIERRTQSEIRELRQKIEDEQREVRLLDEENKEKAAQIKLLEEERQRLNEDDETDESREADRLDQEKDRRWHERLNNLNITYSNLYSAVVQAKAQYEIARERLTWCENARRASTASVVPGGPFDMETIRQGVKQRRARQRSSLNSNMSSLTTPFHSLDTYASVPSFNANTNVSPTFPPAPAFFNPNNGMTLVAPSESPVPAAEDIDTLTGGAPMSPRADSLLPANLLGDESADDMGDDVDLPNQPTTNDATIRRFPSVKSRSLLEDHPATGSPSSVSSSSRSFPSPHESVTNVVDSDRRSLRSSNLSFSQVGAPENLQSTSRKLVSGLFSFNRQRGKTLADEGPVLGSLKQGQSQSYPRNLGEGFDTIGPQRRGRRLSYGGNWAAPMSNLFPRTSATNDNKDAGQARLASNRRGFPNLFFSGKSSTAASGYDPFSASTNPLEPSILGSIRGDTSSPRPSSTYSFDKLPRPSTESQFYAWGPPERSSNLRGSPLGPDWGSSNSWSRSQSRRPSIHYGSTSNVSLAPPAEEDFLEAPRELQRPLQAPIGTRPTSSQRPLTPKLNPAAPTFTTLFAKRADKNKDKSKAKDIEISQDKSHPEISAEDASPPESRKSKDARSIATATSMAESRESLERTTSGTTASDTTPAKETFIQKITRKSSSNKFNSWKEKGGLFGSSRKAGEPSTPNGEIDEDGTSSHGGWDSQLGKGLVDSTSTTPIGDKDKGSGRASIGWSFMRKSKKGGGNREDLAARSEMSESSERASEVEDEEVEDA